MRSSTDLDDCVSVSNNSSESFDSVLYDPGFEHNVNYSSECDSLSSPPMSSDGVHHQTLTNHHLLLSDDADSFHSDSKASTDRHSPLLPSSTTTTKKYTSYSANSSPFLGRKNLVSANGSIIWDSDGDWIQLYDRMLRMTSGTGGFTGGFGQQRQRACGCVFKRSSNDFTSQSVFSSPQHLRKESSGAADEEMFMNSFEEVPRIQIFSVKDLEQELNKIKDVCSDSNSEWEKRTECLRKFRSLLLAGAADYDEFYAFLKPIELPFQISVKDLRSQVVREACISIAYLSQRIGNKCDRFAEALLPTLINLIQNCAKIMSSSAVVAIRFIIQNTHANRLIPVITYNISSKSKEIRKACCEFLDQLLHTWSTHTLEKHVGILQEAIKKGISDANPEARAYARKAFWGFADKFKIESDYLLSTLDSGKQKMLQGEQISNWSSTNSLNRATPCYSTKPQATRSNSTSVNGSLESINRHLSTLKRSAIPVSSPKPASTLRTPVRANSAIDIDAQKRARAKANTYLTQPKMLFSSVYSSTCQTPRKPPSTISNDERSRIKKSRVSKSQPGSRSTSPSSRLSYYSNAPSSDNRNRTRTRKLSVTSREQSPSRTPAYERRLSNSSSASRNRNYMINSDLDLSNNKILHHNDEQMLENALLMSFTPRKKYYDDHSDESETSSICSDVSFANYGQRKVEDVSKILENLSSTHWSDRKDGLMSLATFFRESDRVLNPFELKRITDIFTKMLVDPHTKAFSLFLTILNELIQNYKLELNSWLYILVTRLFLKVGSDTLGSIQTRILKTFELIRESFPIEHQFNVIMRLMSDQTQTLNAKVKVAILQYLSKLIFLMESSDFTFDRENNHDIQTSLMKIISWTADIKSSDLRKNSQETIVDLYNLNSTEMIRYISGIPKTYQDAAQQIISHKRKTRPSHSSSEVMQTPYTVKNYYTANKINYYDDAENLNPDEIYDSLKKTTDEIQKYSFDSENLASPHNNYTPNSYANNIQKSYKKLDHLSSASLDSGISQIDGLKNSPFSNQNESSSVAKLTAKLASISLQNNHSNHNNSNSKNANESINNTLTSSPCTNGFLNDTLISKFKQSNSGDSNSYQKDLNDIIHLIQESTAADVSSKFFDIYGSLLTRLESETNYQTKVYILQAIGQIVQKSPFEQYMESTILHLLECGKDVEKEVIKATEEATNLVMSKYKPTKCFHIIQPRINSSEIAISISAIKMLTKLVECNKSEVNDLLPELMPSLLQAYDNKESAVRKATVFCLVAIYGAVGETMNSYLNSLTSCKMRLLKLYIDRSIQTNNGTR
ncbi:hypothetical protein RDWZM_003083 [Blomia tropicalis]|uniref:TOG domain-containing protein n=1 Tax=Blomia tropicalis TaxID=40697 RepID=A0A9Q0ME08_BLOTA|nr:hypothetical protein RDWZM_003083 [Blomia tropicalis]